MQHRTLARRFAAVLTAAVLTILGVVAVNVSAAWATGSVENDCMHTVAPVATDDGDGTASLTWSDECANVINNGQSNSYYNVEVSTDGGATWTFLAGPVYTDRLVGSPGQNGAVDLGAIDSCTAYTFRVIAVVETGNGHHTVTSISMNSNTLPVTGVDCGGGGGTGTCDQISRALTLGYYSNKNGQATLSASDFVALTALNLRNADGSARDFTGALATNKTNLAKWLLGAKATNMAYMLSAQLATLELNVLHLLVDPSDQVCEFGNETIGDIITDADSYLSSHGVVLGGDASRPYAASLETIIDEINNDLVSVI